MRSDLTLKTLSGAPVAVLGFGRSGRSVTDYLLSHGICPTVYEQAPLSPELTSAYTANGVRFCREWPHTFPEGVLVRSPGIRPDLPAIRRALACGAMLTGECDLFLSACPATTIGVTGSDGKTTTANMIAALLRASGRKVLLGGNNGGALLSQLDTLHTGDFAVVELSSFQLMTTPAPEVAVLTNLTPNHLNWHTDYEEYASAKCRICHGASRLVLNAGCPASREIGKRASAQITWFAAAPVPTLPDGWETSFVMAKGDVLTVRTGSADRHVRAFADFPLKGRHNRENFAAAVAALGNLLSDAEILAVARNFHGVPHRMQCVGHVRGVCFINSSIDTSPTRTAAALCAMDAPPIVIAGGRGKGIPLDPLAETLATRARAVFLYGETAPQISALLRERIPCCVKENFRDCFLAAAAHARAGDTVLLSPGCTAFDQFRDFEERGECFCRLVEELAKERI